MKTYQRIFFSLAVLTGIFIFYISSLKFPPSLPGISYISLIYHFGAFFLFSLFLFLSFDFGKRNIFLVLSVSFLYALVDEIHQYFVPGRVADIFDLLVDFAGSLFSLLVLMVVRLVWRDKIVNLNYQ